jgi:hypothetical protein
MDTQTADAIEVLRGDIRGPRREVRGAESSLTARIDGVESSLTARIDGVESSISSLRAEMHELHADARAHTDVLTESIRDDIRIVAEAVLALSAKVDTLRR